MSDKEIESMLNTAKDDMEWTERAKHLDEAGIKKQAKKKEDILEVGQLFFFYLHMYKIEIGQKKKTSLSQAKSFFFYLKVNTVLINV